MHEKVVPNEVLRKKAAQRVKREVKKLRLAELLGVKRRHTPKEGLLIRADFTRKEILWPKPLSQQLNAQDVVVYTANLLDLTVSPTEKELFADELQRILEQNNGEIEQE